MIVEDAHRQAELQLRRLLHRHVEVDLEDVVLIDGREHGRSRHAIAGVDRKVADRAGDRRRHAVVIELAALLANLFVERLQLRFGGAQLRLELLDLALADRAGAQQRLVARDLLLREFDVRLAHRAHRLQRPEGRLLRRRVDFEQQRALRDALARSHRDAGQEPFDFRLDGARAARLRRRHVFGGLLDRLRGERDDLHRHRRRSAARPARTLLPAATAAGCADRGERYQRIKGEHLEHFFGKAGGGHSGTHGLSDEPGRRRKSEPLLYDEAPNAGKPRGVNESTDNRVRCRRRCAVSAAACIPTGCGTARCSCWSMPAKACRSRSAPTCFRRRSWRLRTATPIMCLASPG